MQRLQRRIRQSPTSEQRDSSPDLQRMQLDLLKEMNQAVRSLQGLIRSWAIPIPFELAFRIQTNRAGADGSCHRSLKRPRVYSIDESRQTTSVDQCCWHVGYREGRSLRWLKPRVRQRTLQQRQKWTSRLRSLLKDLKARGLLKDTGRTEAAVPVEHRQLRGGDRTRSQSSRATMWMAGSGVGQLRVRSYGRLQLLCAGEQDALHDLHATMPARHGPQKLALAAMADGGYRDGCLWRSCDGIISNYFGELKADPY